jgi:hypothetical protein
MEMSRKTESYLIAETADFGLQGWELVSVIQSKDRKGENAWFAFLKRPYFGAQASKGGEGTDTHAD